MVDESCERVKDKVCSRIFAGGHGPVFLSTDILSFLRYRNACHLSEEKPGIPKSSIETKFNVSFLRTS